MNRRTIYVAITLLGVLLIAAAYEFFKPATYFGALIDPPKQMPDFTLSSGNGAVSLNQFQGKYVALFFGYTHCKDLCPLTMANLAQAMAGLGNKAEKIQVIFISVDYPRDTPADTSAYAQKYDPAFIGVTGTKDQIDQVTRNYDVAYSFDPPDANGNYDVEHTALVLLLNPQGQLILTWNNNQPSEMAADLENLVK